ncbi:MAG TPA: polysaccharide pyruvyl transferase family protein [Allocoleopsis sp.]
MPLCWVATTDDHPFANLGDALSPVIVSALSGRSIKHQHFDANSARFACVGTIGQDLKGGTIHLWGTGIDAKKKAINQGRSSYQCPDNTTFHVHALRGPFSAQVFSSQGVDVPPVYGDPVWFLSSLMAPAAQKQYELGVIVHLTELASLKDASLLKEHLLRYQIPTELKSSIRIITTLVPPTFDAIEQKVKEITSCKRIVSTSLHGLVIAETYGIPCLYLRNAHQGVAQIALYDEQERIDQRMRDFYAGVGCKQLFTYGQKRNQRTDWNDVIQAIDTHWQPIEWNPHSFLETFPLPLAFNPLRERLIVDQRDYNKIQF